MIFGRIACLGILMFLFFGIRASNAGQCLFGGPQNQFQSYSVEWRKELRSSENCIQGGLFNNVALHSINLTSPPQSRRAILLHSAFAYTPTPDFQGDDSFAVSESSANRRMSGASTTRIAVSLVGAPQRPSLTMLAASNSPPTRSLVPSVSNGRVEFKSEHQMLQMNRTKFEDWSSRWEKGMILEAPKRYCDTAMGEEIGWLLSPILEGYYYGYLATNDTRWIDLLINCADAWIARAIKEPDGYLGWPKFAAAGTDVDHLNDFFADSMLGEAMALRPIMLLSCEIIRAPYFPRNTAPRPITTSVCRNRFSTNGTPEERGAKPMLTR